MATGMSQQSSAAPNEYYDANHHHPRKRRRRELVPEEPRDVNAPEVLPEEIVTRLLDRSSAMILQSTGFTGFTMGAQERMRELADDFYLQMLHTVGDFTRAQRRTKPTVLDFEEMLLQKNISLAGLEGELNRVPSKTPAISLPPPAPSPPSDPDLTELLGPELDGSVDQRCRIYDHLPAFPSLHTYQSTPVFAERPTDPRMIREKATAEARLAETALRKLLAVSATRKEATLESEGEVSKKRKERHEEWKKAFAGLSADRDNFGVKKQNGYQEVESMSSIMNDPVPTTSSKSKSDDGYLEVLVNADSRFWRKDTGSKKRPRAS